MPYVPYNRPQSEFKSGKTILASQDFKYTVEGGTLDAAAIGDRYVEVGEPFIKNDATGRYVPFTDAAHIDATTGAIVAGFSDPVICDVDFNCDGVHNPVVGPLMWQATVYEPKLPAAVTDAFKRHTPNIRYESRGL